MAGCTLHPVPHALYTCGVLLSISRLPEPPATARMMLAPESYLRGIASCLAVMGSRERLPSWGRYFASVRRDDGNFTVRGSAVRNRPWYGTGLDVLAVMRCSNFSIAL